MNSLRFTAARTLCVLAMPLSLSACGGGSDSAPAVNPPVVTVPVITVQPVSVAAPAGSSVTFSVTATGNGLGYQWLHASTAGGAFSAIPQASTRTYTLTVDSTMNGNQFRVWVQNSAGIAVSDPATLNVQ